MATPVNIADFDRVIAHFDGNNNDLDDIAALPVAASVLSKAGLSNKSAFFYNNNLGEPEMSSRVQKMRQSAGFAEKQGIQTFDYQADTTGTTQELVEIFNSGEKVLALEGGPMEAVYRGLEQTAPENRGNVTLISHSSWNEERNRATKDGVDNVRTWDDIRQNFPEVELIEIKDQNGGYDKSRGFNGSGWSWLDNTDDPTLQEARSMMNQAGGDKINDASDAGMAFFAVTGQEAADVEDARVFLTDGQMPTPVDNNPDDGDTVPETPTVEGSDNPDDGDTVPETPTVEESDNPDDDGDTVPETPTVEGSDNPDDDGDTVPETPTVEGSDNPDDDGDTVPETPTVEESDNSDNQIFSGQNGQVVIEA